MKPSLSFHLNGRMCGFRACLLGLFFHAHISLHSLTFYDQQFAVCFVVTASELLESVLLLSSLCIQAACGCFCCWIPISPLCRCSALCVTGCLALGAEIISLPREDGFLFLCSVFHSVFYPACLESNWCLALPAYPIELISPRLWLCAFIP